MSHTLATVLLAPLLYWQGRRVRRRVPRLPEPDGQREGVTGNGAPLGLLVLGDSAAAGVGASDQHHALLGQVVGRLADRRCVLWTLLASTGATTASAREAVDSLQGRSYDVVVTSLGVNDVTSGGGSAAWRSGQAALRAQLRSQLGATHLVVCGLPPMHAFPALPQPLRWYLGARARQFDAELRRDVAAEPDCSFVGLDFSDDASLMATDGFHPGPGLYSLWGERVANTILGSLPGTNGSAE